MSKERILPPVKAPKAPMVPAPLVVGAVVAVGSYFLFRTWREVDQAEGAATATKATAASAAMGQEEAPAAEGQVRAYSLSHKVTVPDPLPPKIVGGPRKE